MKVVIVDDDVIFMDALKMDLLKHFDVFDEDIIIHTFDDPMELTGHYNIYFIDIDLIKYNGIAIANEIRENNRNSILWQLRNPNNIFWFLMYNENNDNHNYYDNQGK